MGVAFSDLFMIFLHSPQKGLSNDECQKTFFNKYLKHIV